MVWSRTSPNTVHSLTWAASMVCCTSPTWHGRRVRHPSEVVQAGQEITAKILKFDTEKNRVSLGLKQMGDDPWMGVNRRYPQSTRMFGKITNIADYGAFVELELSLIHI